MGGMPINVNVKLTDRVVWQRFKIEALRRDVTASALLERILRDYLEVVAKGE